MPTLLPRSTRRLAALAVPILLAACRTASSPRASAGDAARAAAECAPATIYVASAPRVFVAKGEEPFLLLDSSVARRGDADPSLAIGYLASFAASVARAEDAPRRAAATASVLIAAFAPVVPAEVHEAVVTALFGGAGAWGVGLPVRFVRRDDGAWQLSGVDATHPALVPPLPARVERRVSGEDGAVLAARRFLEALARGDRDGAWELVSAAVKATTSRRAFEEDLGGAAEPAQAGARHECFREYAARPGDFTLGEVLDVCFEEAGGADRVQVRLDDDQEWRVVRLAHFGGDERHAGPRSPSAGLTFSF